ncbi:MAG: tRNA uracil 4-sulfurtransferase ThiI [Metamycoplasmataceae bacterium]
MIKKILIRYGELSLKKKNKMTFVKILAKNIQEKCGLKKDQIEIKIDRIFIPYEEKFLNDLNYVFGISSFSIVDQIPSSLEDIKEHLLSSIKEDKEIKTFKIAARRNDKQFPIESIKLNSLMGELVLNNSNYKVDIKNPEITFNIEVHKNYTYIFYKKHLGLGGLPVGSSGKVLHLISGGIDSPVAAFLLMKRGLKVSFLSFLTPPHTDEKTKDKINRIISLLSLYQGTSTLFSANYSSIMNYISLISNESYRITLMRRSFYRIATKIAKYNNFLVLSNGENIGQVASQTIESMSAIHEQTNMPVFSPLLTYDKNEIINLAIKINTYEISIEKAIEACEFFAPPKPVTKPKAEICYSLEEKELINIKNLEEDLIKNQLNLYKIK